MPEQFSLAFERFAQSLGDANGGFVRGMNKTDDVSLIEFVESVRQRTTRCLDRVTFSPESAGQCPANFKSRPTDGIEKADPTNKLSSTFLFNRPRAIPSQLPVSHDECHVSPGFHPIQSFSPEESHDFGISAHLLVCVEVFVAPGAKNQAIGFKSRWVHCSEDYDHRTFW